MSESTGAAPAAAAEAGAVPAAAGGVPTGAAAPAAGAVAAPPSTTLLTDPPAADPAKPAEGAASADPAKPADTPITPVVYEAFTLPEGIAPESPLLTSFSEEAAKLGIPQAQAQALVSAVGARIAADAKAAGEAQMSTWVATNEAWQNEIKADPNIGGSKFEAMKSNVARLFDDYVGNVNSPERKALNEALLHTGAGNNPAIVRAFAKISAAHTEGGFVAGNPARAPVNVADLMYPSMARPNGAG